MDCSFLKNDNFYVGFISIFFFGVFHCSYRVVFFSTDICWRRENKVHTVVIYIKVILILETYIILFRSGGLPCANLQWLHLYFLIIWIFFLESRETWKGKTAKRAFKTSGNSTRKVPKSCQVKKKNYPKFSGKIYWLLKWCFFERWCIIVWLVWYQKSVLRLNSKNFSLYLAVLWIFVGFHRFSSG